MQEWLQTSDIAALLKRGSSQRDRNDVELRDNMDVHREPTGTAMTQPSSSIRAD